MTIGQFTAEDWVERLAQALTELAKTQERYRDEIDREGRERVLSESALPLRLPVAFDHPSHDLSTFYGRASSGGQYSAEHYGPLRTALAEVQSILAAHPVRADVMEPSDDDGKIQIWIANRSAPRNLLGMIGGLIARGMEVPDDGFRVAAAELHRLLAPGDDPEQIPGPDDLSVGYHVALFYGLHVREKVPLADDLAILPFEQLGAFVNEHVLQDVAPPVLQWNDQKSVGALIKPFQWKLELQKQGAASAPALNWGGSFSEDAVAFVELLALCHVAPVIRLATIPYCVHRSAVYLLGVPHYHSSYDWHRSVRSFDFLTGSTELSGAALAEAIKAFGYRQSANYQYCAPIISRLTEALARSGRFQAEDKILDVAIALERMYELEGNEISFKLKMRVAAFLETSTAGRVEVLRDVKKFYAVRSGIVHKRKKPPSAETIAATFTKGFEVARRSVVKLLQEGSPADWDKMVLAETEPSASKSQGGDGTT